jgi:hypothetical protein
MYPCQPLIRSPIGPQERHTTRASNPTTDSPKKIS